MPQLYFKLGVGINSYQDERLGVSLSIPDNKYGAIDYLNINENISSALTAGTIIQITEEEFVAGVTAQSGGGGLIVNPNYLLTLNSFINGCPDPGDAFFFRRGSKWYGVLWSDLKACVGNKLRDAFRVGDPALPYPQPGDTDFTLAAWIGMNWQNITITINGVEIPNINLVDPSDLTEINHWDFDSTLGKFTTLAPAALKDIMTITEI